MNKVSNKIIVLLIVILFISMFSIKVYAVSNGSLNMNLNMYSSSLDNYMKKGIENLTDAELDNFKDMYKRYIDGGGTNPIYTDCYKYQVQNEINKRIYAKQMDRYISKGIRNLTDTELTNFKDMYKRYTSYGGTNNYIASYEQVNNEQGKRIYAKQMDNYIAIGIDNLNDAQLSNYVDMYNRYTNCGGDLYLYKSYLTKVTSRMRNKGIEVPYIAEGTGNGNGNATGTPTGTGTGSNNGGSSGGGTSSNGGGSGSGEGEEVYHGEATENSSEDTKGSNFQEIDPSKYDPDNNDPKDNKEFVDYMSNIVKLLQILGTGISIIAMSSMGVKYMLASPGEKATYKETMIPYLIGAIMIFTIPTILSIIYDLVKEIHV